MRSEQNKRQRLETEFRTRKPERETGARGCECRDHQREQQVGSGHQREPEPELGALFKQAARVLPAVLGDDRMPLLKAQIADHPGDGAGAGEKASVAIPGKSASSANSFRTPSFSKVTMRSMMPNKDSIRAPRLSEIEAMKRADSC